MAEASLDQLRYKLGAGGLSEEELATAIKLLRGDRIKALELLAIKTKKKKKKETEEDGSNET